MKYYKIRFRLASPLAVSSGENSHTDSDIILDSRGQPMIPATSLAGAIRHYLGHEGNSHLFGFVTETEAFESKLRFYDAKAVSDSFITIRDSTALKEEEKVCLDMAKFDKEAVETNAEFLTLIESDNTDDDEEEALLNALAAIHAGQLRIGSKSSRGYGQLEIVRIQRAVFCLPEEKKDWLDFEPYDWDSDAHYTDITEEIQTRQPEPRFTSISLKLRQCGAVSIRSYTVKNQKDARTGDISEADYIQLSTNDGVPVIPGTSWAGAFRQRFREFVNADKEFMRKVWGFVDTKEETQQKSNIYFSESRLQDGTFKLITRNAIDRFSARTKEHALYKEKTYYHGTCSLMIHIRNDESYLERCLKTLCAVICDFDGGYQAVGGMTSVGRGLFSVEEITINGTDVTDAMRKRDISAMTGGVFA